MNFLEHSAKAVLRAAGIEVPEGQLATTAQEAGKAAGALGPCAVKAQAPTGKRGKAGGIALAQTAGEAEDAARRILGMTIAGHEVETVLVEQQADIQQEFYVAILNDAETKRPMLLFSIEGGMDIEDIAEHHPGKLLRHGFDIRHPFDPAQVAAMLETTGIQALPALCALIEKLHGIYLETDAELLEINPLVLTTSSALVALDCKLVIDDSALPRQRELAGRGAPAKLSNLEARARAKGLSYVELDGNVGILSNGAGLTMTTMDAVRHHGGQPANFLEMGGNAFVLGKEALAVVLANPKVKSLLINFCGAIARTDVMIAGVLDAWDEVAPRVPVFFSIHGTGEDEAIAMLKDKLGVIPFDLMDDAVKAAVAAAQ